MWAAAWLRARKLIKLTEGLPGLQDWVPMLMRMTHVSVIAYLVGGAFLSLAYLDLAYYMVGYVIIADRLVRDALRSPAIADAAGAISNLPRPSAPSGPTLTRNPNQGH
jgi:hypothetical protein